MDSKRNMLGATANLGNVLHITEDYIPELNMAKDQNIPESAFQFSHPWSIATFAAQRECTGDSAAVLDNAEALVRNTFLDYEISMDLNHTKEDGFTSEVLYDSVTKNVVGVMEIVLMEKYLWVESLVISKESRRQGIGRTFVKRLIDIASSLHKTILLYSLFDSVKFYTNCGFKLSSEFPYQEGHHGFFLSLNPIKL